MEKKIDAADTFHFRLRIAKHASQMNHQARLETLRTIVCYVIYKNFRIRNFTREMMCSTQGWLRLIRQVALVGSQKINDE